MHEADTQDFKIPARRLKECQVPGGKEKSRMMSHIDEYDDVTAGSCHTRVPLEEIAADTSHQPQQQWHCKIQPGLSRGTDLAAYPKNASVTTRDLLWN